MSGYRLIQDPEYGFLRLDPLPVSAGVTTDVAEVEGRRFDIVTLLNALKDLREPARVLWNIRERLLKPDGLLVVNVPPDSEVFQDVANAEQWVLPPAQINYFSANSLRRLLEGCGYQLVDTAAQANLGRQVVYFAKPDPYTRHCAPGRLDGNEESS